MPLSQAPALRELLGLPLWAVGRTADMLWLHFGARRLLPLGSALRHETGEVGDFALQVQCPWRFRVRSELLVGCADVNFSRATSAGAPPLAEVTPLNGERLLDQRLEFLRRRHLPSLVRRLTWQPAASFTLSLQADLELDIFTNGTLGEQWRFFVPGDEQREHHVIEFGATRALSDASPPRTEPVPKESRAAHASVRFISETLDPLDVTDLLKLPYSHSHRKGEPRLKRRLSGEVREYSPYAEGLWSMSSEDWVISDDLDDHVRWLLDQLEPRSAALKQLADAGVTGDIFCYSIGASETHAAIPEATVARANALSLSIDVDHYDNSE